MLYHGPRKASAAKQTVEEIAAHPIEEGTLASPRGPPHEVPLGGLPLLEVVSVLPLLAVNVVLLADLWVGEHLVRLVDLLELRLRAVAVGVHVRMVLASQAAVGLSYVGLRCCLWNA